MVYVLLGGIVLIAVFGAYRAGRRLNRATQARLLRWGVGGAAALAAIGLALARRMDLAAFAGAMAFSVFRYGRLGPVSLGGERVNPGNMSTVRSRYLAMELDHESQTIAGAVIAGQFAGADLMDLGEMETRALLDEIAGDADSLSLLESWLDANRAGWREYFAGSTGNENAGPAPSAEAEAYAILGLEPGASPAQINAAHRELMKRVHPDHGGSDYLASKINEARDLLLRGKRDA